MKLPTTPVNSATRLIRRSEYTAFACEFSDPRGAAASRLLFGFTLDPLPGSTSVYRMFPAMLLRWSTEVYL